MNEPFSQEEEEHPSLIKIRQMYEHGDFETIDKMVRFWEALENLGKLGDMLRRFIIWCGVIAGAYLIGYQYVADWFKK